MGSGGVVGDGGADFVDVGAVDADGFVEDLAGDVEFLGPVGDVGGGFGVISLRLLGLLVCSSWAVWGSCALGASWCSDMRFLFSGGLQGVR